MTSFGSNLKNIREQKKVSQAELAGMIKMHSTHISRYERDLTQPTLDVVKRIAEKLNVSADQLIYGDTDTKAKSKISDQELLSMFTRVQALRKDDIHCVKALLNAFILKTDLQQQLEKV
jgi:transcriptional regulator with XRE-family HTH domain